MKLIYIFIVLFMYQNISYSKEVFSLPKYYNLIKKESKRILNIDDRLYKEKETDLFYDKYFFNRNNIFKDAIDNHEGSPLNCGILSLKKPCYKSIYKIITHEIDENTMCLNIYAMHVNFPESVIVQDTILFVKDNQKWKIVGNRLAANELQIFVFMVLNEDVPIDKHFTNRCYTNNEIVNHRKSRQLQDTRYDGKGMFK